MILPEIVAMIAHATLAEMSSICAGPVLVPLLTSCQLGGCHNCVGRPYHWVHFLDRKLL